MLGKGLGALSEFTDHYASVFVFSEFDESIKRRNVIFRESVKDNQLIPDVDLIVVDRDRVKDLDIFSGLWAKYDPFVIIEGDTRPETEFISRLLKSGYLPTETYKTYQFWKKNK